MQQQKPGELTRSRPEVGMGLVGRKAGIVQLQHLRPGLTLVHQGFNRTRL
jgi:hypothetical protein